MFDLHSTVVQLLLCQIFYFSFIVLEICFTSWRYTFFCQHHFFFFFWAVGQNFSILDQMDIPKWSSWEEESLLCCNDANVLNSITDVHYRYFMMYSLNSTDNLHFYVHCCRQRFCLGSPLRVIFHPYLCTIPCYSLHSPIVLSHTCRYIFVILWMKVFPSGFLVLLMKNTRMVSFCLEMNQWSSQLQKSHKWPFIPLILPNPKLNP